MRKFYSFLIFSLALSLSSIVPGNAQTETVPTTTTLVDGATDFPDDAAWYTIQQGSYSKYAIYDSSTGKIDLSSSSLTIADEQLWCFVGDETNGYKIYNKAGGTDKILSAANATNGNTTLVDVNNVPSENNTTWDYKYSSDVSSYIISQHGNENDYVLERSSNKQTVYYSSTNLKSDARKITLTLVETKVSGVITPYASAIDCIGFYSASALEPTTAALKAYTASKSNTNLSTLQSVYNTLINSDTITYESGKYYSLIPVSNTNVTAYDNYTNNNVVWGDISTTPNNLWKITNTGTSNGMGVNITVQNANTGRYIGALGSSVSANVTTIEAVDNVVIQRRSGGNHKWRITIDGSFIKYFDNNVVGYSGTASNQGDSINWYVRKINAINVSVSEVRFASLHLPFAVKIPDGVTAYIGSSSDVNTLYLTALTSTIPANTPVILEANEGTYSFVIEEDDAATTTSGNQLLGVNVPTTLSAGNYVFNNGSNGVGFYLADTAGTLPANKAYLPSTTTTATMSFVGFDFNKVTDIESSVADCRSESNAVYYDLTGRCVAQPVSGGIYVTSTGKKVLFK